MMSDSKEKAWEKLEGYTNQKDGLLLHYLAKTALGKGVIVEIGSWKGKSTIKLAEGSEEGNKQKVYAIDHHKGSEEHKKILKKSRGKTTFEEFKENIKYFGYTHLVCPIKKDSKTAAKTFKRKIELLFIDGAHDYKSVKTDLEVWFPKLIKGGVVVFHDCNWSGPRKVIEKYVKNNPTFDKEKRFGQMFIATKVGNKLIELPVVD